MSFNSKRSLPAEIFLSEYEKLNLIFEQIAAIIRSIPYHSFNGNKRKALDTLNILLKDFNLKGPLSEKQKKSLINDLGME